MTGIGKDEVTSSNLVESSINPLRLVAFLDFVSLESC